MVTTIKSQITPAGGGAPAPGYDYRYTSLTAWADTTGNGGRRGNLITRDTIEIAEIFGGGNAGDLDCTGFTTDASHYIWVRAAPGEGHGGVFNASKAYVNTSYYPVNNVPDYTRYGPGISLNLTGGGDRGITLFSGKGYILDGLIIKAVNAFTNTGPIRFVSVNYVTPSYVKNCVVVCNDGAMAVPLIGMFNTGKVYAYNNTLTASGSSSIGIGFWNTASANAIFICENNYIRANISYGALGSGSITKGTHDATANTDAITPSLQNIAYSNANFVNTTSGSEDLHLTGTSALKMKGASLAEVLTDYEGDSRVGLVYDIGADQESDVPVCWNYVARYKNSSKLFKTSGCGPFPKNLRVPGNIDKSTGRMVDDGVEIDPSEYQII